MMKKIQDFTENTQKAYDTFDSRMLDKNKDCIVEKHKYYSVKRGFERNWLRR